MAPSDRLDRLPRKALTTLLDGCLTRPSQLLELTVSSLDVNLAAGIGDVNARATLPCLEQNLPIFVYNRVIGLRAALNENGILPTPTVDGDRAGRLARTQHEGVVTLTRLDPGLSPRSRGDAEAVRA